MAIGRITGSMLNNNLERQGQDLAIDTNLFYANVSTRMVGINTTNPQYPLHIMGNAKIGNVTITGNSITTDSGLVQLGSIANVHITGGSANYVIYTDGNGNLNFGNISQLVSLEAFTGNGITIGSTSLSNPGVAVSLSTSTTVTDAIAQLNQVLSYITNSTGSVITTTNITGTLQTASQPNITNLPSVVTLGGAVITNNAGIGGVLTAGSAIIPTVNTTSGNATTLSATNFSSGNIRVSGGYVSALANITATTANFGTATVATQNATAGNVTTLVATNFSTSNAQITGGSITGISIEGASTLVATNFSTANALITGGSITGITNAGASTLVATNLSTGNAVISGGYISSLANATITALTVTGLTTLGTVGASTITTTNAGATTLVTTNFSSGNAQITGGYFTGASNLSATTVFSNGSLVLTTANTWTVSGDTATNTFSVGTYGLPGVAVKGTANQTATTVTGNVITVALTPTVNVTNLNVSTNSSIATLVATNFSTANAQITGGSVTGITNASASTLVATNLSTGNAVISGGYISSLANATVGTLSVTGTSTLNTVNTITTNTTNANVITSVATNFSTANAQITGGAVNNLTTASAGTATIATLNTSTANVTSAGVYTLQATNLSTGNAVITGGYINGLANLITSTAAHITTTTTNLNSTNGNITTLVATNFSTANANITAGSITGVSGVYGTTGQFTNFSTGNVLLTGGNMTGLTYIGSTTGYSQNFSSGNALITGGQVTGLVNLTSTVGTIGTINATAGNINTLYAANISSSNISITGGTLTGINILNVGIENATNLSSGNVLLTGGNIYNTPISGNTGYFTTAFAGNLSTSNVLITGGSITGINIENALQAYITNFSTGNAVIKGGYITGVANVYATTAQATNLSTGNAVITGGYVTGVANVYAATGVTTNFSTANAVITGGSLNSTPIGATTASTGAFTTLTSSGVTSVNGNLVAAATTSTTNTTTGALVVKGGAGFGQDINVGGNITLGGTVQAPTIANPFVSNNALATTQFVQAVSGWTMATIPMPIYGGTYSFASVGINAQITYTATNGVITGGLVVAHGGSGYYTGDLITIAGGNYDSVLRATATSGGSITAVEIVYGGTGYASGTSIPTVVCGPVAFFYNLTGTLTNNATFVMPLGTYYTASNQWFISNNTTNSGVNTYQVTFKIANGSGGTKGTGVMPVQGVNNSRITVIQSDGVNDIYSVNGQTYLATTTAGGVSGDAIIANFNPPFYNLPDGLTIVVDSPASYNQTQAPTINVNYLGALPIVKGDQQLLNYGDISGPGHMMMLTFNATYNNWVLQNPTFGVGTTGVQYHDFTDFQWFFIGAPTGTFHIGTGAPTTGGATGNIGAQGETVYQGTNLASATATGTLSTIFTGNTDGPGGTSEVMVIQNSVDQLGNSGYIGIWKLGQPIYGATSGAQVTLVSANTTATSDSLFLNMTVPYKQLLDGLTIGGGFNYVNQTTTPTITMDTLGTFPVTKGALNPLLLGDIAGGNHEGLLTFNLGAETWVLQNPTFGVSTTGVQYQDATGTSDALTINFAIPYQALTDGLTIGGGAQYVNQTTTPTLNVDGLGAYPIVKGTNSPLLVGDIGGNNHEMLLTFNLGTQSWVLQNPIFGVGTTGVQYHDVDDYQYFTANVTHVGTGANVGGFAQEYSYVDPTTGETITVEGETIFQGPNVAYATATGTMDTIANVGGVINITIEDSVFTANSGSLYFGIWDLTKPIKGATSGATANLLTFNSVKTSDTLFIDNTIPYQALLDGLTIGGGAQYINQTATPQLTVDGFGPYTMVKGVNSPLLAGDIGGNNHEMLLTFNLGTTTWVLQNPIFGVGTTGVQYQDVRDDGPENSDILVINFAVPYQALLDGLTIGGGAVYINQTSTPTLNVDGLGAYPITKGTNTPLLVGDIGGNNHEMLLTFNLGLGSWVLQNPIFGVVSKGLEYQDIDDYQYFTANLVTHGTGANIGGFNFEYTYVDPTTGATVDVPGDYVYQGNSWQYATAYGQLDSIRTVDGRANVVIIQNSTLTSNSTTNIFGIWNTNALIHSANTGATANLYAFMSLTTTDELFLEHSTPYGQLLDGLTVGSGFQYPNQTTAPVITVDGFGPFPIVKGANYPLLPGDIAGNNHEGILTFNFGTQTWVLQNPTYGVGAVGTLFADDVGIVNALVANFAIPFLSPIEGGLITVEAANTNTSSSVTLNVNGLGAKPVVRSGGNPLLPGDIQGDDHYCLFTWNPDEANWILQNPYNVYAGNVVTSSATNSTSTSTGALVVDGGVGIAGNAYIGSLNVVGTTKLNGAANAVSTLGVAGVASLSTVNTTGVVTVTNTTDSTGLGSGALVVTGGMAVSKTAYVGGNFYIAGNLYVSNVVSQSTSTLSATSPLISIGENYTYPYNFDIGLYSHITDGSGNIAQYTAFARNHVNNYWTFASNIQTNPSTGGGITINFTESDIIYDTVQAGGLILANTTTSTSTSTGALVVGGGAGIVGNIVAGASYTDHRYFANGTPIAITTIAGTSQIVANAASGFNVGLSLVNTGVTVGTYGSATTIPTFTVGADGRITSASTNSISSSLALTGTTGTGTVNLLSGSLTFSSQYGVSASVSGGTVTISTPQDLRTTASPTFGNVTISDTLQAAYLEIGTNQSPGTSTLAGTTIMGGGLRVYSAATADGSDSYGDIRYNTASGAMAISSKSGALYLQSDHGTGGVVFGDGNGNTVGTVDASGNANFVGTLSQANSPVLTVANYNSYAPTNTGTGATGTWNINVTGTAAAVAASALTGTTLASGVVSSSLTTVGTLTALTVSGTTTTQGLLNATDGITASYVYAGTIGNTGAVLNGTIGTAAQPNITTVGTLTALNVTGQTAFGSNISVVGNIISPAASIATLASTNFSSSNVAITGGYATGLANVYATTARATNFSSPNVLIAGGSVTGLTTLTTANLTTTNVSASSGNVTTLFTANLSTANAQITGGNVTANIGNVLTLVSTNFSTANALITGGSINGLSTLGATTAVAINFSTGNALIQGGTVTGLTYLSTLAEDVGSSNITTANIPTLVSTNFSSPNVAIYGGYINNLANITSAIATVTTLNSTAGNVVTLSATNFSSGNIRVSGGYISGLANATVTTANIATLYVPTLNSTNANIANLVVTNLYSGNITGSFYGTVPTANVALYTSLTNYQNNQTYCLTFANAAATGNTTIGVSGQLTFNPAEGILSAQEFVGTVNSTAIYALNFSSGNAVISGGSVYGLSNVAATSANIVIANISTANIISATTSTLVAANLSTANAQITGGNIAVTNSTVSKEVVTNFSTGNAVISGGYISSLANATVTTANIATLYVPTLNATSGNILSGYFNLVNAVDAEITGGNVTGLMTASAITANAVTINTTVANVTTLVATNLSTGNAVITGGYITGVANVYTPISAITNFSTANAQITGGQITGTPISGSTGYFTTTNTTNFSTANAVITGGYVTGVANVYTPISAITNFSTGNAVIAGGYVNNLANLTATTTYTTNLSTGNAVITGGYVTGVANVYTPISAITNFSTGNAVITGGYVTGVANVYATTGVITNFSTANVALTGGYIDNIVIGGNTANAGSFTTVNTSDVVTINSLANPTGLGNGALVVASGGASIQQDLWVGGTIYTSNLVSQTQSILTVQDPLLYLEPINSYPYNFDIGFYSHFTGGPANVYAHTGFVRNYNDSTWYLFSNVAEPAGNLVNLASASLVYDSLKAGGLTLANTTASTSQVTGALKVAGGAGINGALFAASVNTPIGNITTGYFGSLSTANAVIVGGYVNNLANLTATTTYTTNLSTGNAVITGGSVTGITNASATTLVATNFSTANAQISGGSIAITNSSVVTEVATNFSTGNAVIVGGYVNNLANLTATTTYTTNLSTGNAVITGGSLSGITNLNATTVEADNFSSGNAQITGGAISVNSGVFNSINVNNLATAGAAITGGTISGTPISGSTGYFTKGVITNFSTANALITGGSLTGINIENAITAYAQNFSTGNAQISGGQITGTPILNSTGAFTTLTASSVTTLNGNLVAANYVDSTSVTTGAVVIPNGGIGVAGNITAGTNVVFANIAGGSGAHMTYNPTYSSIDFVFG
jgi:hypothetical protein